MRLLEDYITEMKGADGIKVHPRNLMGGGVLGFGNVYWVDGDSGVDTNSGTGNADAFKTIQKALNTVASGDVVLVRPRKMTNTSTDPVNYAEALTISVPNIALIGVDDGRTQGGLPQIEPASGTAPIINIKAPGCLIANLGINGGNTTGGGIELTDDGGTTSSAFGTTIANCHFKNCTVTATDGRTGGAIYWGSNGGGWQTLIKGNRFYKNVGDIIVVGTGVSVPQDVIIEDNVFGGPTAVVDVNIYTGGSGVNGLIIRNNTFTAIPALSTGQVKLFMNLTGSVGVMANNQFGANGKTFDADDGTGGLIPTTIFMAGNYQEVSSSGGTTSGEFGRDSA